MIPKRIRTMFLNYIFLPDYKDHILLENVVRIQSEETKTIYKLLKFLKWIANNTPSYKKILNKFLKNNIIK